MSTNKQDKPKSTTWGEVSSWYDEHIGQEGSYFHQSIILPGVEKLLNLNKQDKSNFSLLDLACGQGVLERYFSPLGINLVGIDISGELIEIAQKRDNEQKIKFIQEDVTKLLDEEGKLKHGLKPASFDAVTIILAIQNITPLSAVWKSVYQLLKPKGNLIIVMMHPCFRIPQSSDWYWNDKENRQERTMWNYLSSQEIPIIAHPGKESSGKESGKTTHFHRPLQAYINTLGNASLYVDHIEEWVSNVKEQEGVKSQALLKAKKEFPLFLTIRAKKV